MKPYKKRNHFKEGLMAVAVGFTIVAGTIMIIVACVSPVTFNELSTKVDKVHFIEPRYRR